MPRKATFPPYPRKKHHSGQARISIKGKHVYLGVHGSPASHSEYRRLYLQWSQGRLADERKGGVGEPRTISDVLARFWIAAEKELYRDRDGNTKDELKNYRWALEPLEALYGPTAVGEFAARDLKAVLRAMVSGDWMEPDRRERARKLRRGVGWSRAVANRNLSRCKYFFRWAESEGLVREGLSHHLDTVAGLEMDQLGAREGDDAGPVAEDELALTLPRLNPVVRDLVELLVLSAARPKEIRTLRPIDITRTGRVEITKGYFIDLGEDIWAVELRRHKLAHKKLRRVLLFGPPGIAILKRYLAGRHPDAFLFSPAEAMAHHDALRRLNRKTKVQPSQECRKKANAQRKPGDCYTRVALERSLKYAQAKANKQLNAEAAEKAAKAGLPAPEPRVFVQPFHPYQLRHNAAFRLIKQFDWDVARIILGHTDAEMTRRYGAEDLQKAAEAMRKVG